MLRPVLVVRAMWLAFRQDRIETALSYLHPDVIWRPMTRPGQSQYIGHAGTLQMLDDMRRTVGDFRVDFDEMWETDDGRVLARGRSVTETPDGEMVQGPLIEAEFAFKDGLIISMDSRYVEE